jgi:hypothetical protein
MAYHLDFTDKAKEDIGAHTKAGNKAILNKLLTQLGVGSSLCLCVSKVPL